MSELETFENASPIEPETPAKKAFASPSRTAGYSSQPIKAPAPARGEVRFSIYGQRVRLIGPVALTQDLAEDFSYFVTAAGQRPAPAADLTIEIRQHKFIIKPEKFFKTKNYTIYGRSLQRYVEYEDGSKVIVTHNLVDGRLVSIMAHEAARSYELAYLVLHSFVGEKLEARGLLRLHALAFNRQNCDVILFLPSGGGKSSLAAMMLKRPDCQIYSDEVTLLENSCLRPYPWRIGLDQKSASKLGPALGLDTTHSRTAQRTDGRAKYLLPIPTEKIASPANEPAEINTNDDTTLTTTPNIYWGVLNLVANNADQKGEPVVRLALFKEKLQFLTSVVLGLGLMQMAEYIVRTDNFQQMIRTGFRRLIWALKAVRSLRVIEVTRDYDKVLSVLGEDLATKPHHQPNT